MADQTTHVWEALNTWAATLKPWQRRILALATRSGVLTPKQIGEVYELFLEEADLREKKERWPEARSASAQPSARTHYPTKLGRSWP